MKTYEFDMEQYMIDKCRIADAFCAVETAADLTDEEVRSIRHCLTGYNYRIESEKSESEEPESDNMRLGGIVKMWMMCHEPSKVVEVIRGLEESTDGDTVELLHDVATMIDGFAKELNADDI
jgi:hypothetical protein